MYADRQPYRSTREENELAPSFDQRMEEIRRYFFSRDPAYWPALGGAAFAAISDFRRRHLSPDERLAQYPDGPALLKRLRESTRVPEDITIPTSRLDPMITFLAALSKNWEDPASVENVVTMPSDPAIYGSMVGALANANLVHPEYSEMAAELENVVVRQIASLAGYDPDQAAGIFTQGGTFCNLYGYLLGIRKSLPGARLEGLEHSRDYRIINSQGGHYSNTTVLSVLGVNLARKTIRIRLTYDNDIDLADLEDQLTACFQLRCAVPTIMLTMGTTDTFGVDRVKPVAEIRDRLCERFEIETKPHIHVDSAIGWALIFFLDYDFEDNPLEINPATLRGLRRNVERFRELRYADSFTVDFQKWGFVPYTSSLVMVRDRRDLAALANDPENFTYFEKDAQGHTHYHYTIECSRGAQGLFGAYSALRYLGVNGYRTLIAHGLQNANYFRYRLSRVPGIKIIAGANQGPSVGFRMYPPERVADPHAEFACEYALQGAAEWEERIAANNAYHRRQFLARGKRHLYTNWVEAIAHTDYDEHGRFRILPGEKAVFMNPATSRAHIDAFVEEVHQGAKTSMWQGRDAARP